MPPWRSIRSSTQHSGSRWCSSDCVETRIPVRRLFCSYLPHGVHLGGRLQVLVFRLIQKLEFPLRMLGIENVHAVLDEKLFNHDRRPVGVMPPAFLDAVFAVGLIVLQQFVRFQKWLDV